MLIYLLLLESLYILTRGDMALKRRAGTMPSCRQDADRQNIHPAGCINPIFSSNGEIRSPYAVRYALVLSFGFCQSNSRCQQETPREARTRMNAAKESRIRTV